MHEEYTDETSAEILSISELNSDVRQLLEENFSLVWVEGEISNFVAAGSGHWYFSLKDENAQVRCALFRGNQRGIKFLPKNGMHVLVRARISLYEPRGDFQLIASFMEERGEGKLRRQFEELKNKLEKAGWFDEDIKQELPEFPKQIGVITSPTGAAIRDILNVLKRRYPCVPVIIYPTLVQGNTAAPAIVKAIKTANQRNECDVLIVARGGGSLEDLWPFNEEITAKAIHESKLPIISGVGHEIDFTIADFVADVRAPTPSAAAEIAVPDSTELLQLASSNKAQLMRHILQTVSHERKELAWIQKHLNQQHPKRQLEDKAQQLDIAANKFIQLQNQKLNKVQLKTNLLNTRLQQTSPLYQIGQLQNKLQISETYITRHIQNNINQHQNSISQAAAKLDGISPLATLGRGYAIATKGNRVLHAADQTQKGDSIRVRLAKGELECIVE